jgi:protein TonB
VSNLVAYSAQVALVAAGGTLLLMLLRVHAPAVRYAYWRALLALCLALPWIQGRQMQAPEQLVVDVSVGAADAAGVAAATAAPSMSLPDWSALVLWTIAGGASLRLLWMAVSLYRLRRLRMAGAPGADPQERELQDTIGITARIRYADEIAQPVTFGLRQPVVLLPSSLRDGDPGIRRAVLAHELFHVRHRDWAWVLAEEMVRAALWFHPGVWWLIAQIRIAREERVDELAIAVVQSRRTYMRALLAFADDTPLAPAPAFGRKRHLFRRIQLIAKESDMSSRRVAASCLVIACAIAAGAWSVVQAFPLQESPSPAAVEQNVPGPLERQARPITPENPIPRRIQAVLPVYPAELVAQGVTGTVLVHVTIDATGRVAEIRSGPPQLVVSAVSGDIQPARTQLTEAAQNAVRQWVYDAPAEAPITIAVTIGFFPDQPEARVLAHGPAAPARGGALASGPPPPPPPPPPAALGASESDRVRTRTLTFSGNEPQGDAASRPTPAPGGGGAPGEITPAQPERATAASATTSSQTSRAPIRVGGNIAPPKKITDVKPVYPPIAQSAKISGIVIIEATIDETGRVTNARVLRSVPLLDDAALAAVRQWEFTPTLLNGVPTPIGMSVTVNFTLSDPAPGAAPAGSAPPVPGTPVRVGGNIAPPRKIQDMRPVYPAEALAARVSGIVIVETVIGADGTVTDARVIRSIPLLDEAALAAVRQWRFSPTLLNGVPTPIVMSVTVNFTLPE